MKTDYQPKSKWSIDDENPSLTRHTSPVKTRKVGRWVLIGIIVIALIAAIAWLASTPQQATKPQTTQKPTSNIVSIPLTLPKKTQ